MRLIESKNWFFWFDLFSAQISVSAIDLDLDRDPGPPGGLDPPAQGLTRNSNNLEPVPVQNLNNVHIFRTLHFFLMFTIANNSYFNPSFCKVDILHLN